MISPHTLRLRTIRGPISTDDIIPGRYKHMYTAPEDLAPHVFENLLPGFAATLEADDALYCPEIFGIGSSREQAVSSLLAAGVVAVFAPRFGRIFFRNAWNLGLLAIESPPLGVVDGERVRFAPESGRLGAATWEVRLGVPAPELLEIRRAGGLLARVQRALADEVMTKGGER